MEEIKHKPSFIYKAKVIEVKDGDTIRILIDQGFGNFREETLRLYGINTPESRCSDEREKKLGIEAKLFVKSELEGKRIIIESHKADKDLEQDKYGRYLAIVYFEYMDESFNDSLIKLGYARPYFGGKRKGWFDE